MLVIEDIKEMMVYKKDVGYQEYQSRNQTIY